MAKNISSGQASFDARFLVYEIKLNHKDLDSHCPIFTKLIEFQDWCLVLNIRPNLNIFVPKLQELYYSM